MRIVVKEVNKPAYSTEIENKLEAFQKIVGGYIECVNLTPDVICVCNEEGKIRGLDANFVLHGDVICGNVFFVSTNYDDFASLTIENAKKIMELFNKL